MAARCSQCAIYLEHAECVLFQDYSFCFITLKFIESIVLLFLFYLSFCCMVVKLEAVHHFVEEAFNYECFIFLYLLLQGKPLFLNCILHPQFIN